MKPIEEIDAEIVSPVGYEIICNLDKNDSPELTKVLQNDEIVHVFWGETSVEQALNWINEKIAKGDLNDRDILIR